VSANTTYADEAKEVDAVAVLEAAAGTPSMLARSSLT
jgi:hypothetical protein